MGSSLGATLGLALGCGVASVVVGGVGALADIAGIIKPSRSPVWEMFESRIMLLYQDKSLVAILADYSAALS